jgi:hypothetical protein
MYINIYEYRYGALHRIHMYVPVYCSAKNKQVIDSKCNAKKEHIYIRKSI